LAKTITSGPFRLRCSLTRCLAIADGKSPEGRPRFANLPGLPWERTPDFLWSSLRLVRLMRLYSMKAAHAVLGDAPCRKSGYLDRKWIFQLLLLGGATGPDPLLAISEKHEPGSKPGAIYLTCVHTHRVGPGFSPETNLRNLRAFGALRYSFPCSRHMFVACDPNPIAFVCHLCDSIKAEEFITHLGQASRRGDRSRQDQTRSPTPPLPSCAPECRAACSWPHSLPLIATARN
jgi:hypothetical protein